ncbi:MAG: ribonuclease H family protein [Veillonella sp.]|uniref:ribonuclease H family protein n=1 Tax=Veillonella sp. TaxID=1926307 RepID=UPI0025FDC5E3|nr:ribonuclease H family protein [Veillonella sp.]MBS7052729.1 ribonuclease H family protein [Veillonella sp.]
MAKKYYAVRQGRVPGVYITWADCEKQVKGFGGAIYKSFSTEAEARAFVKNSGLSLSDYMSANKSESKSSQGVKSTSIGSKSRGSSSRAQSKVSASVVKPDFTESNHVVAYIDGSYNKGTNTVGAGGVIFLNGNRETFSFPSTDERYTSFWNVAGELLAAMYVMKYAVDRGIPECSLYYDYMGIEMWATKGWKRNNALTQQYAAFYDSIKDRVRVHFHKVAAHTGDTYNEMADALAKQGAGI